MGLNRAEGRFYLTLFRLGPPLLHRVTDLQEVSAAEQTISRRPRIRFPAGTEERRIPISQIVDARLKHLRVIATYRCRHDDIVVRGVGNRTVVHGEQEIE